MIHVVQGALASSEAEGLIRPIRSDLSPVTTEARDVSVQAGKGVSDRLEQMGELPVGGAFVTPGGDLGVSFIIHIVTASDDEPESELSVQRALRNGLRRSAEWGLTSLAVPPLGLGAGRMDPEEGARAQVEILLNHLDEGKPPLDITIMVGSEYEAEIFGRTVSALTSQRFPMEN